MGKKAPKAPAPPDPVATAQAQGQMNIDAARVNFANNAVNQYTPYGSLEWNQWAPDRWSAVQTLAGPEQHMLNQERYLGTRMNDIAASQLERANWALSSPLSFAGLTPNAAPVHGYRPSDILGAPNYEQLVDKLKPAGVIETNPQDTQHIANLMAQREQPRMNAQRNAIRNQLINSGVREGTEAWNRAMDDWNRQQNDFQIGAQLAAGQEQSRMFQDAFNESQKRFAQANTQQALTREQQEAAALWNRENEITRYNQYNQHYETDYQQRLNQYNQQNQLRQNQIAELMMQRNAPLNEIAALMSGSQINQPSFVNAPQFNTAAGNLMDSTYQSYAGQQNAYNAQLQNVMNNRSGMYGLLGQGIGIGALGLGMMSDERLKKDVLNIGALPSGLPVYTFRYLWEPEGVRHVGVMAQEALRLFPWAVATIGGWLMVNYAAIR